MLVRSLQKSGKSMNFAFKCCGNRFGKDLHAHAVKRCIDYTDCQIKRRMVSAYLVSKPNPNQG